MQNRTIEKGHRIRLIRADRCCRATLRIDHTVTPLVVSYLDPAGDVRVCHMRHGDAIEALASELVIECPWYAREDAIISWQVEDHPDTSVSEARRAEVISQIKGTAGGGRS